MASIRKQNDAYEIRECVPTELGPRQRALVSFRDVLTPEVIDEAEANASLPFDRAALVARAVKRGIPVSERRRHPAARKLLAALQRGARLDPALVALLRTALESQETQAIPEHLADAADWIGQPERERGTALRGLLRTADRVVRSRAPLRERAREVFPRFHSEPVG